MNNIRRAEAPRSRRDHPRSRRRAAATMNIQAARSDAAACDGRWQLAARARRRAPPLGRWHRAAEAPRGLRRLHAHAAPRRRRARGHPWQRARAADRAAACRRIHLRSPRRADDDTARATTCGSSHWRQGGGSPYAHRPPPRGGGSVVGGEGGGRSTHAGVRAGVRGAVDVAVAGVASSRPLAARVWTPRRVVRTRSPPRRIGRRGAAPKAGPDLRCGVQPPPLLIQSRRARRTAHAPAF